MKSAVRPWILAGFFVLAWVSTAFSPWWLGAKVMAPFDLLAEMVAPWNEERCNPLPRVHNHFVADAVTQYIPYALFARASYEQDGLLGWNPLVLGGIPQNANTMAIPRDWSQQLYRWLGFWEAWHLGRMVQFILAGIGMLIFLRDRGCFPGIALMGAVAYMGSSQFIVWIYHHWALASFCWMPWLLWAAYRAKEGPLAYWALFSLFLTLGLNGGTLQHSAFVTLVLGCLWIGWLGEGALRNPKSRQVLTLLMLSGILGFGMATPGLEATIQAYFENLRAGQLRGGLGYEKGWLQPIFNFLAIPGYAFPPLLGSPQGLDLWKIFHSNLFNVAFFGTVPVLLAFGSLFSGRAPLPARILAWGGLGIPLTPLVGPLYHRVQLLWILGGCWAAAAWLQSLTPEEIRVLRRRLWSALTLFASLWLVVSLGVLAIQPWLKTMVQSRVLAAADKSQFGIFRDWMDQRVSVFFSEWPLWSSGQLLFLVGFAISIWGLTSVFQTTRFRWLILALGVALQTHCLWWQWTSWTSLREEIYQKSSWVGILQKEVGKNGRLAQETGSYGVVPFGPNTLQPSGVAVAGGYESIHPNGIDSPTGKAWDFPGVTHYFGSAGRQGPEGWSLVRSKDGWGLWENPSPSWGIIKLEHGDQVNLGRNLFKQISFNTNHIFLPPGTKRLEVFLNWHPGWKWGTAEGQAWSDTSRGGAGGILVNLERAAPQSTKIVLRFDPSPPNWARWIQILCASVILLGVGWWCSRAFRSWSSP